MNGPARLVLPELPPAALEALIERTTALVYVVDTDERVVSVNRLLRDRVDYEVNALSDLRTLTSLLYPEPNVRETVLAVHRHLLSGKPAREMEWTLTTRQGDHRQVRWQFLILGDGRERLAVFIGDDVTDRRKLEQWVRLQNSLMERIPEAIVVADVDGRIIHWTGAAERLLGYSTRSALERPLSNLIPEENARGIVLSWIDELRARGQAEWVRELRRENGMNVECRIQASRVQNERGMVAIALVVSPPQPASMREDTSPGDGSLERLLGQLAAVALVITSPDGTVRLWGRGAERLAGAGAGRAVGRRMFDEVMRCQGVSWETSWTKLQARGRVQQRVTVERPNGTEAPAELDAHVLRGADGAAVSVLIALVDRSEIQMLAGEALATKTAALNGVFVDGVVRRLQDACGYFEPDHRFILARLQDLRTITRMVVQGSTLREFDAFTRRTGLAELDKDMDDVMYRLGEGVHRLRTLVDDIGRFEATEVDPPGPTRLTRELDSARDLVAQHFENRVELDFALDDLPPARASRAPLLRGLTLLLLASASSCEGAESPRVVVEGKHQSGWLYLDVRDNGAGYPVDVQSRLTDFAYLASQPGVAPLYLGMAREALRLAGGNLEIGTAAGTGARVRVSFPAADAAIAVQAVDIPRREWVRRGRVLVVEDDDLLRRALERHIGEVHEVHSHPTIAEAINALNRGPYDAAVLAFPRPESFGLRLMARFAEVAPELHRNALVTVPSGLKHATRERLLGQGCIVLTRPVDFTTLRSLLLRLMPAEEIAVGELD